MPTAPVAAPPAAPASPYRVRVVGTEEWEAMHARLPHYPTLPPADYTILLVLENTAGDIVGSWMAMNTVELHGLYLDPSVRHHPGAAVALLDGMLRTLVEAQIAVAVTRIEDPAIAKLAARVGFDPLPGTIWKLSLPTVAPEIH